MKQITLFLLITGQLTLAQVKSGEPVPMITFAPILNAPINTVSLNSLKGKMVLLDFWATWCGACIQAMPHLIQLQKTHVGQLQVITVSQESPQRIAQFLKARPSNLWFALDTAGLLARQFPHQLIPHTVLITPDGHLLAATSPRRLPMPSLTASGKARLCIYPRN